MYTVLCIHKDSQRGNEMSKLNFGKSIKRETVFEIAYKELKSAILSNQLDFEEFYTEEDFAKVLGISRTPVREAVQGLVYDGLLQTVPRKGVKVRGFSKTEINQIFILRRAIEKEVLMDFLKVVTEEQVQELKHILLEQRETVSKENKQLFMKLDQKFHNQIIRGTNYFLIEEFFMRLHDLTVLIGHRAIRKKGRMHEVIEEHEAILMAIEAKNIEDAKTALLLHLDNTMKSYNSMDRSSN